ncbi:MAG: selenocysteine-specific translation elongation factor [Fusobacteriaceae bacterium]
MRNIIIGTAGHIDHGKTTLIKNLTGIDTDTAPEEIKRGLTINLGFAYYTLPSGKKVGIIDVPGHEKFIKNMVAGISGIDFILLVIACDDGIMPQTIEHVNICDILGIDKGLIILTKRDLEDDVQVDKIKKDIAKTFENSFVSKLDIIEISSKSQSSIENLKNILNQKLEEIKFGSQDENNNFRMSIDRVFSVKGFGTVVTGTSVAGMIKEGDEVILYPKKSVHRVKGIQNHGEKVSYLDAGNRCALNLSNLEVGDTTRGDIISKDKNLILSDVIDCLFFKLPETKIKNNQKIRLHIGTIEVFGRVKIFQVEEKYVQLELDEKIVAVAGELGVMRNFSPLDTIGGIKILNPNVYKTRKRDENYLEILKKIEIYGNKKAENFLEQEKILKEKNILEKYLEKFHEENHLKKGISKSEIRSKIFASMEQKKFTELLAEIFKSGEILEEEGILYLKDFKIKLNKQEKDFKDKILTAYKNSGFVPMTFDETLIFFNTQNYLKENNSEKIFREVFEFLISDGFLISLGDSSYIMRGFYLEAEKRLREFFTKCDTINLGDFRELLQVQRKVAVAILEKFDSEKITERINDIRVLKK